MWALNEASQTATQTLSNQINMTTFRLKFAIRIIKKFMGESPNVLLVGSVRVNTDRGVNTDGELQIPIKRNS